MLSATPKLLSGIEDSHHGPSDAIHNPPQPLKVFTMKMEILPVSTSNSIAVDSILKVGNPVKEILLKLNLPDHSLIADSYKDDVEMTTTVVNNSVFRAFFEKQRLTGPNFMDWYRNLRIVLSVEDKLPYLEQPIPAMPIPPAGQVLPPDVLATHTNWVKASKEITGLMLMTMEPDIQKNLEQLGAYDMLRELKTLFHNKQSRNFFKP
ncbi:hypothetical protein Tco_1478744 [Tanacetum coccineum]